VNLIDERGRLFGRINAIDAAAIALAMGAVAFAYTGYRIFRLPPAPDVTAVEPSSLQEGPALRVRLAGRHFLPFMRVFVRRSGASATLVHDPAVYTPADDYTLVNTTLAPWAVESPSLAQVQLPDDLGPGVYDLVFYNETRQVGMQRAAFTITPRPVQAAAPPPRTPPLSVDSASVTARFICRPQVAALVKAGDAEKSPADAPAGWRSATIASISARRETVSRSTVNEGGRWLSADEPVIVLEAVLTVPVTDLDGTKVHGADPIKAGGTLTFETSAYLLRGWILNVSVSRPRSAE
jgi:hypothetical protein